MQAAVPVAQGWVSGLRGEAAGRGVGRRRDAAVTRAWASEWSHRVLPGAEILAYFEDVARRYGIDSRIRYGN
jgi:hypothetical protein